LLDLGKITGYTWPAAVHYMSIVLGLYGLYGLGYRTGGLPGGQRPCLHASGGNGQRRQRFAIGNQT
jgi:hypothetical protein